MYRVYQYRPNLRKRYRKVKVCQWSEKPNEAGVENTLEKIAYKGRFALDEEITDLSVHIIRGKISAIWISCSKPQYSWDNGFNSFMIRFRPRKRNLLTPLEEVEAEAHNYLLDFLKGAEKYFEENNLNVEVRDDDCKVTTIEEILSSF